MPDYGAPNLLQINDPAPVVYTGMRTLTTTSATEANIYQATMTVQNTGQAGSLTATVIHGHSSSSSDTASFWVRRGSLTGTILCSGTTTSTTVVGVASAFTYESVNTVLWWNGAISGGGTLTIDGSGGTGTKSYNIQGRWIIFNAYNGITMPSGGNWSAFQGLKFTTLYLQCADISTNSNYCSIFTADGLQSYAINLSETAVSFTSVNASGDHILTFQCGGNQIANGEAVAFSAVGTIVNI